nr:MAG TPA: hypothetical protein [Caudoviricetes sp.]
MLDILTIGCFCVSDRIIYSVHFCAAPFLVVASQGRRTPH